METLVVFFKDVAIGKLTYSENNYVYKTNPQGINEALAKAYPLFLYDVDNDFVSQYLPESISAWLPANTDSNLYVEAGIIETDTEWEKLVKVSKLSLHDENVYISYKK